MNEFVAKNAYLIAALPFVLVFALFLKMCTSSDKEKAINQARMNAYTECREHWNQNDTLKNTALMAVKLKFMQMDKASNAPNTAAEAIGLICDIEADKAEQLIKSKK